MLQLLTNEGNPQVHELPIELQEEFKDIITDILNQEIIIPFTY